MGVKNDVSIKVQLDVIFEHIKWRWNKLMKEEGGVEPPKEMHQLSGKK
jgi:hypothetical protein